MLKKITLSLTALATTAVMANSINEPLVLKFSKTQLDNAKIEYKNLKVLSSKKVNDGWEAINISFDVKENDKFQNVSEIVLVNGVYMVSDAVNLIDYSTIRDSFATKIDASMYNDEHLILGDKNAKNKILVFSEPFCPFCKDSLAELVPKFKDSKDVALYMYEIPSQKHTGSLYVLKHLEASKNKTDATLKVYAAHVPKEVVFSEDFNTINKWFEKVTGEKLSKKDVESATVLAKIDRIEEYTNTYNVQGTPTVYLNGSLINNRDKILKLFK